MDDDESDFCIVDFNEEKVLRQCWQQLPTHLSHLAKISPCQTHLSFEDFCLRIYPDRKILEEKSSLAKMSNTLSSLSWYIETGYNLSGYMATAHTLFAYREHIFNFLKQII
jgi:hypothetical protein